MPPKGKGLRIGSYQLGSELGKGAFGKVFQGLNTLTGEFVAVKQVSVQNVPKEELVAIEGEIDLLKKLVHPNIVRYVDRVSTEKTLNIVLEFIENGSLLNIVKKFGVFSEALCVVYIVQVLRGLRYLHAQGVIHRDIKGANILITKSGLVKLADFGVAIKQEETAAEGDCVVGTPYWMAPEIIEMSGPSPKCDIWSVGCTVIELLTGKPPYFDLAPMAALFRIVSDDGPALPPGISSALKAFFKLCFQKQPSLRKSADELLLHPWLTVERKGIRIPSENPASSSADLHSSIQATVELSGKELEVYSAADNAQPGNRGFISLDQLSQQAGMGNAQEDQDSDGSDWDADLGIEAGPAPTFSLGLGLDSSKTEEEEEKDALTSIKNVHVQEVEAKKDEEEEEKEEERRRIGMLRIMMMMMIFLQRRKQRRTSQSLLIRMMMRILATLTMDPSIYQYCRGDSRMMTLATRMMPLEKRMMRLETMTMMTLIFQELQILHRA